MATFGRYDEDRTGVNPNNLVVGEIAQLSAKKRRAVIPMHAPFYKEGFRIWDITRADPLEEGVHFEFVDIAAELTADWGKEIYYGVLILDETVSSTVRHNYQCVGHPHSLSAANLQELYENMKGNNTPVDWVTGVVNKPATYNPSLHSHHISEMRGYEPIITQLERIRNAIVLSCTPAFEHIVQWVKDRGLTVDDILNGNTTDKFLTYDSFQYLAKSANFNVITNSPEITNVDSGVAMVTEVKGTALDDGHVLYWDLELDGMRQSDFYQSNGSLTIDDKVSELAIRVRGSVAYAGTVRYRFRIKSGSPNAPVVYRSRWIYLTSNAQQIGQHRLYNACCVMSPKISRNAMALAIAGRIAQH